MWIAGAIIGGIAYILFSVAQSFTSVDLGFAGEVSIQFGLGQLLISIAAGFGLGFLLSLAWARIARDENSN
jgi:NhaP-type Na+/H+ or K+/H+ antiporter